MDAIRIRFGGAPTIYAGGSLPLFDPARDLPQITRGTTLHTDVARFIQFSDGFVAMNPQRPHALADIRYSNLPNSLDPLWGIELNLTQPEQHARYVFYRDLSRETRQRFMAMLMGRRSE